MSVVALKLKFQQIVSSQAPTQAFYVSEVLPWISLVCQLCLTLEPLLVTYVLANENPILVYVVLVLFILSLLDRKSNFYVSMVLDILLLKSFT